MKKKMADKYSAPNKREITTFVALQTVNLLLML